LQQIHNGSQNTLELAVYRNGKLTNADGNVAVNIVDADTGSVITASAVAENLEPTGLYAYEITPDLTGTDRVLKVKWSYAVNSKSTSQNTFVQIVTPYATVSDIIDYYSIGTKPSELNYRSQQEIINAEKIARTQINTYVNEEYGRRYGEQEHFGNGSDALELIERMLTIDKVYENDTLVIDYTKSPVYNTFGYDVELTLTGQAARIKSNFGDVRYDNQVDPTILYYGRFRDHTRYRIVGEIGYNYVPQDVKLCAMLLVGDLLSKDNVWRTKYLKKVTLAEVGFELSGGAFSGTGNVVVDQILDQRRNLGIVVI
jgi:hypothetical protein